MLNSYRVGRTTAAETDRDLAKVAEETAELRRRLDDLDAGRDVAATMETQLTEARALLAELGARADELEDLETGDDVDRWEAQRRFAVGLVAAVRVTTLAREAGRRASAETKVWYVLGLEVWLTGGAAREGRPSVAEMRTALRSALCSTPEASPVLVRRLTAAGAHR